MRPAADGPLAGMRVVEIGSFVACPLAGLSLAQLGADVVRIDPIGGAADQTRWPVTQTGRSLYWSGLNRGKRSVELDLSSPEGQELAVALATQPGPDTGVLLTNMPRGEWLSYDIVRQRRPDIIHARLVGWPDGQPAVDHVVNAALGFPLVTGPDAKAPVNHVLPAWDIAAGMTLALALVAADRERRLTGQGQSIEISLWDVALSLTSHLGYLTEAAIATSDRRPDANYFYGGFGRDFLTSDGRRVMVVAATGRQWRQLVKVTGTADAVAQLADATAADFDADGGRYEHRVALAALLEPWFAARPEAVVREELCSAGVMAGLYSTFAEVEAALAAHPTRNPIVHTVVEDDLGAVQVAGTAIRSRHRPQAAPTRSTKLGEHTRTELKESLGLAEVELKRLEGTGVIR